MPIARAAMSGRKKDWKCIVDDENGVLEFGAGSVSLAMLYSIAHNEISDAMEVQPQ